MCRKIPEDVYHIILHCDITNILWGQIEPILRKLHPSTVTEEEKAFGIVKKNQTTGILLRNWLTYLLRDCISQTERTAYHAPNINNLEHIKRKVNYNMELEIRIKALQYKTDGNLQLFEKMITHSGILCKKREDGEYELSKIFT